MSPLHTLKSLNKLPVTQLAELTNLSKSYISQVRHGKKPPSQKIIDVLYQLQKRNTKASRDYLALFIQSRQTNEVSASTLTFYNVKLGRFISELNPDKVTRQGIERFLLQFDNPGNRHAYFRTIRTFYIWREQNFGLPNPIKNLKAPRLGKLIMPSLTKDQVTTLINNAHQLRDKAIIALFVESGLRLSELTDIRLEHFDWESLCTVRVLGKGKKEAHAPFGEMSAKYLKEWITKYRPNGSNIWGLNRWGIISMLRRLETTTGFPCNPHTFRRTFACLLRKAGVDTMTIKDLGRWESLEMVQRYTRSFSFQDSLKFYKAPLG